jgi:hypothetical protein
MEAIENEKVVTSRDRLKDRYTAKYPEKDFNAEDSENSIDDEIIAELEAYDAEIEGYRTNDKKLKDLFNNDPRSASFMVRSSNSGIAEYTELCGFNI